MWERLKPEEERGWRGGGLASTFGGVEGPGGGWSGNDKKHDVWGMERCRPRGGAWQ